MATAKQRAWRAKFAALYGRKKGATNRKARASVRPRVRGKSMARKKRSYGRRSIIGGGLGSGMIGKVLLGLGAGSLAGVVVGDNPLLRAGAGFVAGGPIGGIAAYVQPQIKNIAGGAPAGGEW